MTQQKNTSDSNSINNQIESEYSDSLSYNARLIKQDGAYNVVKKGYSGYNLYEELFELSWIRFAIGLFIFYFLINSFFAFIFLWIGIDQIKGTVPGTITDNFFQALFFSIQTFTTVGYGTTAPIGLTANFFSSLVAFAGMLTFALATGLFFAKFSKPRSHLLFSDKCLLTPDKDSGNTLLQFRVVNEYQSQFIDAEAQVTLSWIQEIDGKYRRRFQRLKLKNDKIFLFPLNWTVIHEINESSILSRMSFKDLKMNHMEILVFIKAFNETHADLVYAKHSYTYEDLLKNHTFVTMYETTSQSTVIHIDEINNTIPVSY